MKRQEAPDPHLTCQQSGLLAGSLVVGWLGSKKSLPLLLPRSRLEELVRHIYPFPVFPKGTGQGASQASEKGDQKWQQAVCKVAESLTLRTG